jgi:hypothetical protein
VLGRGGQQGVQRNQARAGGSHLRGVRVFADADCRILRGSVRSSHAGASTQAAGAEGGADDGMCKRHVLNSLL